MCGIAGAFGFSSDLSLQLVERMLGRIRHRGRLDCRNEVENFGWGAVGANRLPIESDPGRSQPRWDSSGCKLFVYNGEIYNWKDLAGLVDSPATAGLLDETQSIVEFLAKNGQEGCSRLDGMFAIVWVEKSAGAVHLIRDGFGIKPLYYAKVREGLLVASELKALALEPRVDKVEELSPGACLTWYLENSSCSGEILFKRRSQEQFSIESLCDALEKSVTDCIETTKKAGILLSGGVDSGLLYHLARRRRPETLVLTAGKRNSSDLLAAKLLVEGSGTPFMEVPVPAEDVLFETVKSIVRTVESFEPNVVRQSAASDVMMRAAAQNGLEVLLCGEGADELFGGYPEFLAVLPEERGLLRERFLLDLHRTQLQRVDRTSMALTLEVRVPYLSRAVSSQALAIDPANGLVRGGQFPAQTKVELREAAAKLGLRKECVGRSKVVLSEGMGLGSNDPVRGMFATLATNALLESEAERVRRENADWNLRTNEEVFYFSEFLSLGYTKLKSAKRRVMANRIASTPER